MTNLYIYCSNGDSFQPIGAAEEVAISEIF